MKQQTFVMLALLLFAAQTNAQMVMEWQSPPGVQPGSTRLDPGSAVTVGEYMDFDGDGVKDIPILKKLGGQNTLVVISGAAPKTTWQFPMAGVNFVPGQTKLIGFFDLDPGSGQEVIVATKSNNIKVWGDPHVVNQSGLVKQFGSQYLLLGIADYDKDNDVEMLLADGSVRFLMLWGKGN